MEFLTAEEVAGRLRVEPSTVWKWGRTGRIPVVKLTSKVIRYRLADVLAALESGTKPEGGLS
jgi:excisionase family DNA binding protein